jgi:hypothetical protein
MLDFTSNNLSSAKSTKPFENGALELTERLNLGAGVAKIIC